MPLPIKLLESVAPRAHKSSTTWVILMQYADDGFGGCMSHAVRLDDDDAIIAFLLFCLDIHRAEEQRKRKLH
jgi:hypothetical protein